jgi:hypothetical protein
VEISRGALRVMTIIVDFILADDRGFNLKEEILFA